MKKYILYLIAICVFVLAGCTDIMDDMNDDPKRITNEDLAADGILFKQHIITMEKKLFELTRSWVYQTQQNLNADIFAGYTMPPGSFGAISLNHNYNWNNSWNNDIFSVAQKNLTEFLALQSETLGVGYTDFYSYGLILKILAALPVVDAFGPFPYLEYGKAVNPAFDNVEEIYKEGFLPEINYAIETLEEYAIGDAADRVKNSGADISNFRGDITSWIKLANTLKLRLAMRISNVDETTASQYIKEVVDDSYGVLNETTGDFSLNCPGNDIKNPFHYLSVAWADCIMSADMQSFLVGMEDPRIASYFQPATADVVSTANATYAGVRPGAALTSSKGSYAGYSPMVIPDNFMFISGAESYFLLAEAAARGLGGLSTGAAQSYYENGVTASFILRGFTQSDAATYLESMASPADYVDYDNAENNYSATTSITPKWDGTNMLEQIITQKWIAMYPMGTEAWAEFRRTGYPKLTIPKNMETSANFDGTLQAGQFLKRLPYSSNVISLSSEAAATAVANFLNGNDDASEPLWWDVD